MPAALMIFFIWIKTRILVTHGVHWLPKVDEIIVMDNGRISERGTFQQLLQHNGPFAQFLQVYLLHDDAPEEENDTESMWNKS